jgi:hypothetical protein
MKLWIIWKSSTNEWLSTTNSVMPIIAQMCAIDSRVQRLCHIWPWPHARSWDRCLPCLISCNSDSSCTQSNAIITPFYSGGKEHLVGLKNIPKVVQQEAEKGLSPDWPQTQLNLYQSMFTCLTQEHIAQLTHGGNLGISLLMEPGQKTYRSHGLQDGWPDLGVHLLPKPALPSHWVTHCEQSAVMHSMCSQESFVWIAP